MAVMNKIAIDPKVIEELEATYKDLGFEHPNIDIEKDLIPYIESLEHLDEHDRKHHVEAWIKSQITPTLSEWEMKYSQNSDLLHKASKEIQKLEQAKKHDQINMDNLQSTLGDEENSKKLLEEEINGHRKDIEKKKGIDIKYEKMKAVVLLVFSFLIAIGTYIYFANTQIDINWSTMDNNTKVGKVRTLITEAHSQTQYGVYSQLIVDEDDNEIPLEEVKSKDLSPITTENIDKAPTPNLSEYASIDFTIIILAFSSFLLILMGKITATVYEKLKMPNWMYYLIYILAVLVLIGAVSSNATLSGYKTEKSGIKNQIITLNKEMTRISEDADDEGFDTDFETTSSDSSKIENPKLIKLQDEIKSKKSEIEELNSSIANFKFIMMLLFMFSEILIGSMAWIAYAEYIDKKIKITTDGKGHLDILKENFEKMKENIEKFTSEIHEYQERIALVSTLEHRLTALKRKLHSKDNIKNISQQHMEKEVFNGFSKLLIAESKWKKGK